MSDILIPAMIAFIVLVGGLLFVFDPIAWGVDAPASRRPTLIPWLVGGLLAVLVIAWLSFALRPANVERAPQWRPVAARSIEVAGRAWVLVRLEAV